MSREELFVFVFVSSERNAEAAATRSEERRGTERKRRTGTVERERERQILWMYSEKEVTVEMLDSFPFILVLFWVSSAGERKSTCRVGGTNCLVTLCQL